MKSSSLLLKRHQGEEGIGTIRVGCSYHPLLLKPDRYTMIVSQPSTLLLEESGTFEGAAPVHFDMCDPGEYSRAHLSPGDMANRFGVQTQEAIAWIDGRMSISF